MLITIRKKQQRNVFKRYESTGGTYCDLCGNKPNEGGRFITLNEWPDIKPEAENESDHGVFAAAIHALGKIYGYDEMEPEDRFHICIECILDIQAMEVINMPGKRKRCITCNILHSEPEDDCRKCTEQAEIRREISKDA